MESQINGQFMSVLWKFFLARNLINNNNFTVSLLRRIDPQLFDLILSLIHIYDTWYGMTYHEDVASVKDSFRKMQENGVYKADLFSDL